MRIATLTLIWIVINITGLVLLLLSLPEGVNIFKGSLNTSNACTAVDTYFYPLCTKEYKWVVENRVYQHRCLREMFQITQENCSILRYLSWVLNYCDPSTPGLNRILTQGPSFRKKTTEQSLAKINLKLDDLLTKLKDERLFWLRQRVQTLWADWVESITGIEDQIQGRTRKKLLLYMGAMSIQHWILMRAGSGGPLGELVQWTDLITSSYLLGHDITVTYNKEQVIKQLTAFEGYCSEPVLDNQYYDIIFTDIIGAHQITAQTGHMSSKYRCRLRLLDSFGTEAQYNFDEFNSKMVAQKSDWGGLNLLLPQFYTLYPHTPDNSFLGFVVGRASSKFRKKHQAVLYAKNTFYYKSSTYKKYLDIIHEFFPIHSTFQNMGDFPDYLVNHGVLKPEDFWALLRESKLFVGLYIPYEGPGALEALKEGVIFLNPKHAHPVDNTNSYVFAGKPTSRQVGSQNPYLAQFVREPYVFTVDMTNETELRSALIRINNTKVEPFVPWDFSFEGMLARVHHYIEYQDFCNITDPRWPPICLRKVLFGKPGMSCNDVCYQQDLVCEPTYFADMNQKQTFLLINHYCTSLATAFSTHPPSVHDETGSCVLQEHPIMLNCAGKQSGYRRLCPCRTYNIFNRSSTAQCGP